MYWLAAFLSAGSVGIGGMFYLRYFFKEKEVEISSRQRKIFIPAACLFFAATAALMAAFTSPLDSTVFVFARDILMMHCLFYLAVIDFKLQIIPNKALLVMLLAWAAISAAQIIAGENPLSLLFDSLIGGIAAGGIFFLGNLLSHNGMGMGDVKLMALAGLYLGINKVMALIFWALALSLVTGLVLMAAKKAKIKTAIPLAPFFLAGSLISNTLYILSGFSEV